MIVFLTTADTEILAAKKASERLPDGFPEIFCANPQNIEHPEDFCRKLLPFAHAVLVRLLGGREAWKEGLDALRRICEQKGIPLLAFGGEVSPDADLAACSTVPSKIAASAFEYLRHGGVANTENLFRFVADTLLGGRFGFEEPQPIPTCGIYRPELEEALNPERPTVGIVFYRAHWVAGNTEFVDALIDALDRAGANALAVFSYSLRPDASGRVEALELFSGRIDALVVTVLASGRSGAQAPKSKEESWCDASWEVPHFEALGVPVIQGLCATTTKQEWQASQAGLGPLDAAMQVAIPEFDGRIIAVPFSFKEPEEPGSSVRVYRADPERTARLAELAARLGRLRRIPPERKRIAVILSNYPTRSARVGNAVGLDTPQSAVALLRALADARYKVGPIPSNGDALVHELLASGSYDDEFLTEEQMRRAVGRLDVQLYAEWFANLPDDLRDAVVAHWGRPPGDLYVEDGAIVLAGIRLGNVFVGIQPPRGFGERPMAIYHDPDLPPSHHYLAAYWWLERVFGADAVVHLGKHGSLEWLPGKGLGLSASCAPDAVLGALPLIYPFIVNDPGEGTQAKRRAHAVIIDHLIPPMMRAETYDDLARLEQLLDEYSQLQALDPAKLPEIQARIWELVLRAELHRDLGVDCKPDSFDDFLLHLDGYLCEIKDARIRGGLHVLGSAPSGDELIGMLAALLRLSGPHGPGLRAAVAAAFGLDEKKLLAEPGAPIGERICALGGLDDSSRCSDVIDRLEELSAELLRRMESFGWDPEAATKACEAVLGRQDEDVVSVLRFAASDLVPRIERTKEEIENLLLALEGGFVSPGPSGSPTRGAIEALPTGRNFYSVDPKAVPSRLAWETGRRLADDLLGRYLEEQGQYPETVGIVVWGTSAMRTQGDDIGEILALLGVRPVWNEESRRVVGLEVIPLEQLGRPRIDVVVRISGFFRDAFPNLISLIDEAVEAVAGLDEPDDANFVARHLREALARGMNDRSASIRIFGSKPGAYGAGLLQLIDARNWRTDADLAAVYEVWGGYAYGKGLDGVEAFEEMRESFSRIQAAVKNADTSEHDLLDSDDYFQYHGGMIAAIRALTGRNPRSYIADSSDPGSVRTRSLEEEIRRVFRARVVNPRWIAAMKRHGYKGAFELAATVDYLFGYDATGHVVEDWMYEAVARSYVLDPQVADFMKRSNPWALRSIVERLLEAAERGLWADPPLKTLEELRSSYLETEADLETRGESATGSEAHLDSRGEPALQSEARPESQSRPATDDATAFGALGASGAKGGLG